MFQAKDTRLVQNFRVFAFLKNFCASEAQKKSISHF